MGGGGGGQLLKPNKFFIFIPPQEEENRAFVKKKIFVAFGGRTWFLIKESLTVKLVQENVLFLSTYLFNDLESN